MSDVIHLSLRADPPLRLEVEGFAADRFVMRSESAIASMTVWLGSRQAQLGDFFDVRGGHAARVRATGNLEQVDGLGAGMAGGELVIDGHVGPRLGAGMSGGTVEVLGDAGDDAGVAMSGGVLRIRGDAGDRLGAPLPGASRGMVGGEIVVYGSAGGDVASRVRRGLVVVAGHVGDGAAGGMIAGTLVVLGTTGRSPASGSKRGSLVACGGITVPETYRYGCTYEPPYVRLLMTWLRRQYGVSVDESIVTGRYRRYCGDAGTPGRGEILVLVR
jgi:formylmethanofuran dehydrogenase subunit C